MLLREKLPAYKLRRPERHVHENHPHARGDRRWLIRVYLGRDQETNKRKYHKRAAQAYLTRRLRERDLGRDLEAGKITLNLS
jgi:hypothetical protein